MNKKIISTLVSIAALSAATNIAWAVGTAAGTTINNTATINYSVSGDPQTAIGSSLGGNTSGAGTPTQFTVDKKIDLVVTKGADVLNAVPGSTENITFTLDNNGNSTEFFKIAESQVGGDTFDTSTCSISVAPGTLTASSTIQLVADASTTVTVACLIPSSQLNGDTSILDLKATAVTDSAGGTAYTETGSDTAINAPGSEDVVLADGIGSTTDTGSETVPADPAGTRNAIHSAINTYTTGSAAANLTVTKTSAIISDPINGISANAKRIPGSVVEYSITVTNADGASDATHIIISDPFQVDGATTYVAASCALTGDATVNLVGPSPALGCSESPVGTIISTSFTLPGGTGGTASTATLTFRVTVNN